LAGPQREDYLELLRRMSRICRSSENVRGFYVIESAEVAGDFWEFYEFEDEDAAERFATELGASPTGRELLDRLRRLVPEESTDTSFWQQML
jgi:hypothetical protein